MVQNTGRVLKISDYAPYFKEQTTLGFDSLKPVYAKFKRYIPEFLVEAGMISKEKAKARGMGATSSLKPKLTSLQLADYRAYDPARAMDEATACPNCGHKPTYLEDPRESRAYTHYCHNCNKGLGSFQDSPELLKTAIDYLARSACDDTRHTDGDVPQ